MLFEKFQFDAVLYVCDPHLCLLSFSYFPSFLFFLPTNATEDGDSRVGGDVANPLEFISPPTRWTIEVGLVFYSVP